MAESWLALIYSWDGHPWDVSARAARLRLPRDDRLWIIFIPLWMAVAVSPLAGLLKRPRWRWLLLVGLLLGAAAVTVVWRPDSFVR